MSRIGVMTSIALLAAGCTEQARIAHAPTAFAGFDRNVRVGTEVVLDASLSTDPDGDQLTFTWRIESAPAESTATLDADRGPVVRFVPNVPGTYIASLAAADADFVARDLVGIRVTTTISSTSTIDLELSPHVCQGDLGRLDLASCGIGNDRVAISSDIASGTIEWRFLRLPTGTQASDLDIQTGDTLTFTPSRPGDYWIAATRRVGEVVSNPALAAVGVFDGDAANRPEAMIMVPRRVRAGSVVLFDGRSSVVPTSSVVERLWRLEADPSGAQDPFTDNATGCPPNRCRRLIPSAIGTYIVSHTIVADGRAGVTAIAAVEVE